MSGPVKATRTQKILLLIGTLVVGLALLEAAARVRMHLRYGHTGGEFYTSTRDAKSGLKVPDPNQTAGAIHINSLGFRGRDLLEPKPTDVVRVAFLGGSTTFCTEASSDDATWPALLCRRLGERFEGVRFEPVNAALPALRADDSRRNLEHRVRPLDPDVVFVYHATNDISRDTRNLADAAGIFTGDGGKPSWLAERSVAWDLIEKNVRVKARQHAASSEDGRLEFDPASLAEGFRDVLTRLVNEAGAAAPLVVVPTFSTRFRPSQPDDVKLEACNTALFYMPYMTVDRLLETFAAYNEIVRQVGRSTGALLIEGEDEIPGDGAHFTDSVHFTDLGCEAMVERLLPRLVTDERFLAIVASKR